MNPIWAKSIWHATPGSPSPTRAVVSLAPNPHPPTANLCAVRYSTERPSRISSSCTLVALPTAL